MSTQRSHAAVRAVYLAAYVLAILLGLLLDDLGVWQQVGLAVLIMLMALGTDRYITHRASRMEPGSG